MPQTAAGVVAVTDVQEAGAITYWALSGDTDVYHLEEAWKAAGLAARDLPDLPTPAAALSRAVHAQVERRLFARALDDGGWSLVYEVEAGKKYDPRLHVHTDVIGRLKFSEPDGSAMAADCPDCQHIAADYEHALGTFPTTEFGSWLAKRVAQIGGVTLRTSGGFYFVDRDTLPQWNRIAEAVLAATGHRIYTIPALHSAGIVASVVDAITAEAAEATVAFTKDLEDETKGATALRNRSDTCKRVAKRVERFEHLLGTKMSALRERLDALQANLAAAALLRENAAPTTGGAAMAFGALPGF